MASRGAVLRGAASIPSAPGGARPTPAPQGSIPFNNAGTNLNAPSIGQMSPLAMQLANEGGYARAYGPFLPRPTQAFTEGAFGPFSPILPVPVDAPPPGDFERPEPRRWQYPVGWNLPTGVPGNEGLKLVPFETLRRLADVYSVARAAIEYRKSQIKGVQWDIVPTPDASKAYQNQPAKMADFGQRRGKVVKFFNRPDPNYLSYSTFVNALLEEVLVYDALSILLRPVWGKGKGKGLLGSDLDSLMLLTGTTIRPLVDLHGGTPRPPSVAYQQFLYGVPRSDLMTMISGQDIEEAGLTNAMVTQFRGDQLIYAPMNQRAFTPYGFGPVERAIIPIQTGLQKQFYEYDFFGESSLPAAYIVPGDTSLSPNQLRELQDALNAIAGDPAWKQKLIVLPPGSHVEPFRPQIPADELDQLVMTQVTMAFAVTPMELGIMPDRSSSASSGASNQMAKMAQQNSNDSGVTPILQFLQGIFNSILVDVCGQTDMLFQFEGLQQEEDMDSLTGVLVQQFQNGMRTLDECRQELNLQPYGLEESTEPLIVTPTGPTPLSTAVANAQAAAAATAAQAAQTQAGVAHTQAQTAATHARAQIAQESHATQMNEPGASQLQQQAQRHQAELARQSQDAKSQSQTAQPQAPQHPQPSAAAGVEGGNAPAAQPSAAAGAEGRAEGATDASVHPTPGHQASHAANEAVAAATTSQNTSEHSQAASTSTGARKSFTRQEEAELEALARHLLKGRYITTWEPRHISQSLLADVAKSMAHGLSPVDAVNLAKARDADVVLPKTDYEWQDMPQAGKHLPSSGKVGGMNGSLEKAEVDGGASFRHLEVAELVKVGPHGYVHGWKFVGVPLKAGDIKTGKDNSLTHKESGESLGQIERFVADPSTGAVKYRVRTPDGKTGPEALSAVQARGAWLKQHNDDAKGITAPSAKVTHADIAAALNNGKALPPGPDAAAVRRSIARKTSAFSDDKGWKPKDDVVFHNVLKAAPHNSPDLYRGIGNRTADIDQLKNVKPGDVIRADKLHNDVTSWSDDSDVADGFTLDSAKAGPGFQGVVFHMAPGAKALNIQRYAGKYKPQKEWVTSSDSTYQVTGTRPHPTLPHTTIIDVRQVPSS